MHTNDFHTAGASTTSSRRLSRSAQHTVHRHTLGQKLIRHLALWTLSQISGSQMDPAICPFSSCHFFRLTVTLCVLPLPYFPVYPSDVRERDLVELVLEVSVSQVSQRQRDMLLRQVGVLLGVLDSDIIVREISAFNEHR